MTELSYTDLPTRSSHTRRISPICRTATSVAYALSNNSRDGHNRELSYPSVLPDRNGGVHVAFTYHRRAIRYLHLPTL